MNPRVLALAIILGVLLWLLLAWSIGHQGFSHALPRVERVATVEPDPWTTTTTVTLPDPPTTQRPELPRSKTTAPISRNGHACGGDLPPCSVMMRESKGDPNAYNPHGCGGRGCYGKWQCDPRTCTGQGTEAQQDAEARALWDGGRGCHHWDACAA